MEIEIRYYAPQAGVAPFQRWFDDLDPRTAARVTTSLLRLQAGNTSAVRSVGAGVHEVRIDHGPGWRIYFGWDGPRLVILLGGGSKRRQQDDIDAAQERWRAYRASAAQLRNSREP